MKHGVHWWFCTIMMAACIAFMIWQVANIVDVALHYPTHS